MQAAALPLISGWNWVKDGWLLFKRQPLAFTSLALFISLIVVLATQTSPIGPIVFVILMPAMTFMIMSGCQQAAANKRILPMIWFQAFKPPMVLKKMIGLGTLYLALCLLGALVSFFPFMSELSDAIQTVNASGDFEPLIQSAQIPLIIFLACYALVTMLFWYAPMLVAWHSIPLTRALFFSLIACWRNKLSMLVYGFIWIVIFLSIDLAVSFLGWLGLPPALTVNLQFLMNIIAASVMYCSFYPNYVSVFQASD